MPKTVIKVQGYKLFTTRLGESVFTRTLLD